MRSIDEHIGIVYAALRKAVKLYEDKQESLAEDMRKAPSEVSRRLNRVIHKGELHRAHLDMVGFIGTRPAARAAFLEELAAAWGYRLEPIRPPTAEERLRIVSSELSSERRRQLEQEHHLPARSLG